MTRHWMWGAMAAALWTAGCSHGSSAEHTATAAPPRPAEAQAQPGTPAQQGMGMTGVCPMTVPGTQVSASDTTTGEALTFTTSSPDRVDELRSSVRAMADMHNRHHASGQMGAQPYQGMGSGSAADPSMRMAHMPPPSTASVEDTDGGARLVVTPKDSAQLPQLQSAMRAHADMMQQGHCGMMGGGMQGQ